VAVLVEGRSRHDAGVWSGKTGQNVTVNFTGDAAPGTLADVVIDQVKSNSLFGSAAGP
jgi:tRNA A37 methylthiotransferase MiaB